MTSSPAIPDVLTLRVAQLTSIGGRSTNEDALSYAVGSPNNTGLNAHLSCFALSDGAGGHGGGDIAAQTAVSIVINRFKAAPQQSAEHLLEMMSMANDQVIARQSDGAGLEDMHATLVVLTIDAQARKAMWSHIGDSRLYRFRSIADVLTTKDHSVFQAMLEAGIIKPGSPRTSPNLNALTKSLGEAGDFSPSIADTDGDLLADDVFLICSDGFWDYVNEREMKQALRSSDSPDQWLEAMHSILLKNKREGNDNYSAIAVWVSQ